MTDEEKNWVKKMLKRADTLNETVYDVVSEMFDSKARWNGGAILREAIGTAWNACITVRNALWTADYALRDVPVETPEEGEGENKNPEEGDAENKKENEKGEDEQ